MEPVNMRVYDVDEKFPVRVPVKFPVLRITGNDQEILRNEFEAEKLFFE